jgi:2-oxoglutarate dehydrogenase E1 component
LLINLTNIKPIEKIYEKYLKDAQSIDPIWRAFFEGFEIISGVDLNDLEKQAMVINLINAYRKHGFKYVDNNPLIKNNEKLNWKEFNFDEFDLSSKFNSDNLFDYQVSLSEILEKATNSYCNRIGYEFDHCDPLLKDWLQRRIENKAAFDLSNDIKQDILKDLSKADIFESFLNTKYPGQKRFSLEGAETVIPIINTLIGRGEYYGLNEIIIGMSHRGRLNVLANIAQKPYSVIFYEFEDDYSPLNYENSGDVKYHKGFSSTINKGEKKINIHLSANPSHLESINPVVLGQTYAKRQAAKDSKVLALLIHGDASFAGQGVIYESLQFMRLKNYSIDGAFHIIVNNQIGFTTPPEESKSTLHCTDIAKAFGIPVFHVNVEDPESCIIATKLALEVKHKFKTDVILDLICYRKYGHNEGDEPMFTQPLQYGVIKKKKAVRLLYQDSLIKQNIIEKEKVEKFESEFKDILNQALNEAETFKKEPPLAKKMLGDVWAKQINKSANQILEDVNTGINFNKLKEIITNFSKLPVNFNLHPKLSKWINQRLEILQKDQHELLIDWSYAEMLALASLLIEKIPIRFAGQDAKRGTFNQRHLIFIDQKTAQEHLTLNNLSSDQALFEILNTPLSEFAALGFEYGYSLFNPKALVLWEAQFGDFCNGAQILIDQYISSAEVKWQRYSNLTLLLPHGYEGQGPEHSSARIERFLQLASNNNIQIVNCTVPSQYFHLLRRQALRDYKKPLIVFTPKSLLRHPLCKSSVNDLKDQNFKEILEDIVDVKNPNKIIFCSGKVFFDLIKYREDKQISNCLIIRVEQLYPLRVDVLKKIIEKYTNIRKYLWVQEEPKNMGAWEFIYHPLQSLIGSKKFEYVGRCSSASTAVGSYKLHHEELNEFLNKAFYEN